MTAPILLMTRPRAASDRFIERLSQKIRARCEIVISPLIRIEPTDEVPVLDGAEGVIFSSTNGVRFAPDGQERIAYCVGRATATHASERGWQVSVIGETADDLVMQLTETQVTGPLIHLAGHHRRGKIAERLCESGVSVQVVTLYDQVLLPLADEAREALVGEATVIVPLFSPRTAAQFAKEAPETHNIAVLAMSAAVAEALEDRFTDKVRILPAPNANEMRQEIENWLRRNRLP